MIQDKGLGFKLIWWRAISCANVRIFFVRLCAFSLAISRRVLLGIRFWVVPQVRIAPDYPISASIKKLRAGESWKIWQAAWSGWVHIPAHHHHFRWPFSSPRTLVGFLLSSLFSSENLDQQELLIGFIAICVLCLCPVAKNISNLQEVAGLGYSLIRSFVYE
jgi:hypothetical protein